MPIEELTDDLINMDQELDQCANESCNKNS